MLRDLMPVSQRSLSPASSDPLIGFRRAIDRLFQDFSSGFGDIESANWPESSRGFTPRLDLEERDDKIILLAELPGMTDKDVQIEINRDILTIKGEKKTETEGKERGRSFSERCYGSFERTLRLPSEVNRDKIDASLKDGILTVTLPKSAEAKREVKKISVHH